MINKSKTVVLASKKHGVQVDIGLLDRERLIKQYEQEYQEKESELTTKETLYANYDNE